MGDRPTLAQNLLDHYPSKALEILIDCLNNTEIRAATEQWLGRKTPPPARLEPAFEQQPRSSQPRPSQSGLSPLQRTGHQHIGDARHGLQTPPTSAGSVRSHGSSLAGAGMERIYLVSSDDDNADQPVISRSASVSYNLIGDKVVLNRGLGTSTEDVYESISVPLPNGGKRSERVFKAVNLTWRRCKEFKSNWGTFYIVPSRLLDCDVILGTDDSLEHQLPPDVQDAHSPQARSPRRGFVEMEDGDPTVLPPAPTAPIHSHQQTTIPPNFQRLYDRFQASGNNQPIYAAGSSGVPPHPRHGDREQTGIPLAAQESSSSQLQVVGVWDKTPMKMSFDPNASGEAFYQAFHQWAVRRKRDGELDRHRTTLWLKGSKDMPDDEAYELGLKEEDMELLWEDAVQWIQDHKSPKAPHLFVTVELEAG